MRNAFVLGLLLLWSPMLARAQTVTVQPDCIQPFVLSAVGTSAIYDNRGAGCVNWTLVYSSYGFTSGTINVLSAPNAINRQGTLVAWAGTVLNGVTQPVSIASQGTISVSGYYPYVGMNLTAKAGTGSIQGTLYGYKYNPPAPSTSASSVNIAQVASTNVATNGNGVIAVAGAASSGLIINTAVCSGATCYTSGVNSGLTVITSGSTTTLLGAATAVSNIWCANLTASAVTITITDGNNGYYVGPNYSLAALTNGTLMNVPPGAGIIMAAGVKASAGTASAVNCQVEGRQ